MSHAKFVREISLPVDADEAFAWHARPGAFERLVPPWQEIAIIDRQGGVENGARLTFKLHRGPVPVTWVAEHRDVEPGKHFRDVQVEGPFAAWDHCHSFHAEETGSRLRDEIDYALPLGVVGSFVGGGMVEKDLERVFRYRHRMTRDDLEAHARYADRPRLTVAIAGASGLIGSALSAFLTTGGHRVLHLVRRPAESADEVRWDPEFGVAEPELLEGVDAVVTLAGENIAGGRWTATRKKRLVSSRVAGVRRLVASLKDLEHPPRAFIAASAIGFYGDRGEENLDEASASGEGFLAELSRDWEAASDGAAVLGARVVQLRFGVVLSPRGGALAKMLPAFRLGAGGPLGSGKQYLSWIGLDDAVGAIHHALQAEEVEGAVNVTGPEPLPQKDFAKVLGRILSRPTLLPTPAAALRLAFGEMADEALLASTRAEPRKLLESGYRFRDETLEKALGHVLGVGG